MRGAPIRYHATWRMVNETASSWTWVCEPVPMIAGPWPLDRHLPPIDDPSRFGMPDLKAEVKARIECRNLARKARRAARRMERAKAVVTRLYAQAACVPWDNGTGSFLIYGWRPKPLAHHSPPLLGSATWVEGEARAWVDAARHVKELTDRRLPR